jgi:hypothetical protein
MYLQAKEAICMRKNTLAVVISSLLLGAVATQAQPSTEPTTDSPQTQTQTNQPADMSRPDTTASPESSPAPTTNQNDDVGSGQSNVDKPSSSGSYYPYSSGTAGDDPSQPKSTSPKPSSSTSSTQGTDKALTSTDYWTEADSDRDGTLSQTELGKAAPTLSSSFGTMDANGDRKLTRDEFKTWHDAHKASMEADQGRSSSSSQSQSATGDTSSSSSQTPSDTSKTSTTDDTTSTSDKPDTTGQ